MTKRIAIGIQDFEELRKENYFYIDKTAFIKEWWVCFGLRNDYYGEPYERA